MQRETDRKGEGVGVGWSQGGRHSLLQRHTQLNTYAQYTPTVHAHSTRPQYTA